MVLYTHIEWNVLLFDPSSVETKGKDVSTLVFQLELMIVTASFANIFFFFTAFSAINWIASYILILESDLSFLVLIPMDNYRSSGGWGGRLLMQHGCCVDVRVAFTSVLWWCGCRKRKQHIVLIRYLLRKTSHRKTNHINVLSPLVFQNSDVQKFLF